MGCLDSMIHELPQLSKCCCLSLRTGCLILGGIQLISGLLMECVLVFSMYGIELIRREISSNEPSTGENEPLDYEKSDYYPMSDYGEWIPFKPKPVIVEALQGIFISINSIHIVLALLLIIGLIQERLKMVKFWLVAQIALAIVLTLQTLAMNINSEAVEDFETGNNYFYHIPLMPLTIQLRAFWMFCVLSVLTISVVKSHYMVVKEGKQQNGDVLKT